MTNEQSSIWYFYWMIFFFLEVKVDWSLSEPSWSCSSIFLFLDFLGIWMFVEFENWLSVLGWLDDYSNWRGASCVLREQCWKWNRCWSRWSLVPFFSSTLNLLPHQCTITLLSATTNIFKTTCFHTLNFQFCVTEINCYKLLFLLSFYA